MTTFIYIKKTLRLICRWHYFYTKINILTHRKEKTWYLFGQNNLCCSSFRCSAWKIVLLLYSINHTYQFFFKGVCKYQCTRWVNNTNLVQMARKLKKSTLFCCWNCFWSLAQGRGLENAQNNFCSQYMENVLMLTTLDIVSVFLSSYNDQRYHCFILLFFADPGCMWISSDMCIIQKPQYKHTFLINIHIDIYLYTYVYLFI